MSDRGLSAQMIAALANDQVATFWLLELVFDHQTIRFTDAHRDLTWNSVTWHRTNGLLGIAGISETAELNVNRVTASLSGVDKSIMLQAILQDDFIDRPMRVWVGIFDADWDILASPEKVFDGRMDAPSFSEDPTSGDAVVSVEGTPHWADFGKKPGRHTNHEEQIDLFPGDRFFDLVSEIPKEIKWGRV